MSIDGTWFPDAFIGPMAGLQCKIEDENYLYLNSVENALKTMCVVDACYHSSASGTTPVTYQKTFSRHAVLHITDT